MTDQHLPKTLLAAPALLAVLLFHFTLVGLHVSPPNPVSIRTEPLIHAYMLPYLAQRWQLFAPEPGGRNDSIHVRCHLIEGSSSRTTEWIDITTPLIRAHQRNRFGQADRMLPAYQPRFAIPRDFERKAIEHLDGPVAERAKRILDEEAEHQFNNGKAHLQRVASAACKRRFGRAQIERVDARVVQTKVVPFGVKDHSIPNANALSFPAMPYVEVDL